VPFEVERHTAGQILRRAPLQLENAQYVKAESLDVGKGYWIFQARDGQEPLDLIPASATRSAQYLELMEGWNCIGPTEADYTLDGNLNVWQYQDGVWQLMEADANGEHHLEAGQGYWLYIEPEIEEPEGEEPEGDEPEGDE